MNPSQSGWLSEFVNHKVALFKSKGQQSKPNLGKHPDQSFYGIIQPTGIMYGYPVGSFQFDGEDSLTEEDKIKVLMAESFLNIAELYYTSDINTESEFRILCESALSSVAQFYNGVYPDLAVTTKSWFGKKKNSYDLVEKVLDKRIKATAGADPNFWSSFFSRSQLFLDVYIFGQWTHTHPDSVLLEFFKGEKEDLSFSSVKVIAAAAHANENIEEEESALFEHFLATTALPAEKRRVAQEYFDHGLGIQELPIQETDPWIIRKFFLELAALTVLSDQKIETSERVFLEKFNSSLGFSTEDFEVSMIAVQGFLLQNWPKLDLLQDKVDYNTISEEYIDGLVKLATSYSSKLESKAAADVSLMGLVKKGAVNELSDEEKQTIRKKFIEIIQSIPEFRVIMLPDDFLTYENLLRIFPKESITKLLA